MAIRKDEVEDIFRSMMLEYNNAHDFWCLPPRIGCYDIFSIRIYHPTTNRGEIIWECQINIRTAKMDDQDKWYSSEEGLEKIRDIINKSIELHDKKRNRGKV